jgi:DNA-binding response OmpR family regulator
MVNLLLENSQEKKRIACLPLRPLRETEKQPVAAPLVLIIENHDDTRSMLKTWLEGLGYQVAEAVDGEQALRLFNNDKQDLVLPNLVLTETVLPGQDGLEVMCALRAYVAFVNVPIVFLSSRAEPSLKSKALELGGNDFLVKPIELDFLEKTLDKYLDRIPNKRTKSRVPSVNGGFA